MFSNFLRYCWKPEIGIQRNNTHIKSLETILLKIDSQVAEFENPTAEINKKLQNRTYCTHTIKD